MAIQYQSALTASPQSATVDGPVTLSVDILILTGDLQQLDATYKIEDPPNVASAVFFTNGLKEESKQFPVTDSQMTLVNDTQLRCGHGVRLLGAQISISIYSGGVLQAPRASCGVGITAYTCAQALVPVHDTSMLPLHATTATASVSKPSAAGKPPRETAPRRASKSKATRGNPKRGGRK